MLKLTKEQVSSIVSVITNKAEIARDKYENGLKKDPAIKAKVTEIMGYVDKIPSCVEEYCGVPDKRDVMTALIDEKMEDWDNNQETRNSTDRRRVENKVTLCAMKCDKIEELETLLGLTL